MELRLNPLYKKLLMLSIVLGPMIWLVMTEDGQRRSDLVLLYLFGKEELNLAIENLHSNMTEADFRALFPELPLACDDGANPFGDRLCSVEIGSFNAIPARAFSLFLKESGLRAAKVNYRRNYHAVLENQLNGRIGRGRSQTGTGSEAMSWQVSDGLLLMPSAQPQDDTEAALLWLSAATVQASTATP